MALAIFGITNNGLNLVVTLFVLMLVVVWLALIVYTYLDARRRVSDPFLVGCATIASFIPYIGTAVYAILRPPEFLEDAHERELEIKAAELRVRQLTELSCPNCEYPVEKNYLRCPNCQHRLKDPCPTCEQAGRPALDPLPLLRDRAGRRAAGPRPRSKPPPTRERRAAREDAGPRASAARTRPSARRRQTPGDPQESSPELQLLDRKSRPRAPPRAGRAPSPNDRKGAPAVSRTLILVKPDAFERALTGEVLARFERKGLRIAALKKMQADEAIANEHYAEHSEKPFFGELVSFITGGPLVADRPRGRRGRPRRAPADRRHQPGRGRPRLDPRRLRARGDLQHGPRLRLRRVGRARDRDLVPRAVTVVLASGSPQRREILAKLGVEFEVVVPGVEELSGGDPEVEVIENARRKARAVGERRAGW